MRIAGAVDNTGGTLNLNTSTGVWDLTGGTIAAGTVNLLSGGGLGTDSSTTNRLSNLVLNGGITLADGGDRLSFGVGVTVNGVITVSGANAEIGLANGASLNSEVVFRGRRAQGASDRPGATSPSASAPAPTCTAGRSPSARNTAGVCGATCR